MMHTQSPESLRLLSLILEKLGHSFLKAPQELFVRIWDMIGNMLGLSVPLGTEQRREAQALGGDRRLLLDALSQPRPGKPVSHEELRDSGDRTPGHAQATVSASWPMAV